MVNLDLGFRVEGLGSFGVGYRFYLKCNDFWWSQKKLDSWVLIPSPTPAPEIHVGIVNILR